MGKLKLSEIAWLTAMAVGVVGILVMIGLLVAPKIKANWFPAPTLEPGISRIYYVQHDNAFECATQAVELGPPMTQTYLISAFIDMRTSNALVMPDGESLEGWSVYWMYDSTQDRLEYWLYGVGTGEGFVYELLPACFMVDAGGMPYVEFSEIEVRETSTSESSPI